MGKSGAAKKKKAAAAGAAGAVASAAAPAPADPSPPTTTAPAPPPVANGVTGASAILRRAHELKEEGNRLFAAKNYEGALQQYELALRLTPRGHPDRAVFHSNSAACLMQMRPVDYEAVAAECSLALEAQPGFSRALLRRARALEVLGRHDLAMQDVNALLAADPAHGDALELARRLRAATRTPSPDSTSRPSPAALGASAVVAGLGPSLPPTRLIPKKPPPSSSRPQLHANPLPLPKQPMPSPEPQQGSIPMAAVLEKEVPFFSSQPPARARPPAVSPRVQTAGSATPWRPLKLVYDHDIRLAQMPVNSSFRALRELVAARYPSSKSVLMKYRDADGDLITITSTAELRLAESSVDDAPEGMTDPAKKPSVLRIHVVEVSPEQEPVTPEEDAEPECEEPKKESPSFSDAIVELPPQQQPQEHDKPSEGRRTAAVVKKECGHEECKDIEVDDWLLQFAELFRNQLGIDMDAHLDLHEVGMELCTEALEETVTREEAQSLFEMAALKFQEVAALALFNWGNVHMCAARKRIPIDESASGEAIETQLHTAFDWVRERYNLAGTKYEEALKIKPDFYEGILALAQQHFESAKLLWSFALAKNVDLSEFDPSETIGLFDSSEEKMRTATEMWEKAEERRLAELAGKKEDALKRKRRLLSAGGDVQPEVTAEEAAEQAVAMRQQIHLFWGNLLFERSQVEFKLQIGGWKENLDKSVERFKLAGASEPDIAVVLKNHSCNADAAAAPNGDEKNLSLNANPRTSAATDKSEINDKV